MWVVQIQSSARTTAGTNQAYIDSTATTLFLRRALLAPSLPAVSLNPPHVYLILLPPPAHVYCSGLQPPSWIQVGGKTEKLIGVGSLSEWQIEAEPDRSC